MTTKNKIKKGDTVKIITGKDKGKVSKVLKIIKDKNRAIVEGVNLVKKHTKSRTNDKPGEIIEKSATIDLSNLMVYETKDKKASRVGFKIIKDKTVRVYKKSGNQIT